MHITPATESERTIIGGLLLDPTLYPEIKVKLAPSDFYYEDLQEIYKAMGDLFCKHQCFDIPMIMMILDSKGDWDEEGLYELANNCVSTANIKAHADIVLEKSVQRQLIEAEKFIKASSQNIMNLTIQVITTGTFDRRDGTPHIMHSGAEFSVYDPNYLEKIKDHVNISTSIFKKEKAAHGVME